MVTTRYLAALLGLSCATTWTLAPSAAPADETSSVASEWSQWRGPLGNGVSPDADPPVEWSETKNVRWKTALPGTGHSTPVVHGDKIFLTTAVPHGKKLPPQADTQ